MLAVTCDACARTWLLPPSRLLGIDSRTEDAGRVVHAVTYRCWCGHLGVERIATRPDETTQT